MTYPGPTTFPGSETFPAGDAQTVGPSFPSGLEELWESLPNHYRLADQPDFLLKRFLAGVCGPLTEVLDALDDIDYTPPEDGVVGDTSALVDIVALRPEWAQWRAQLSGITLPADLPFAEQQKIMLDSMPVRLKGTISAMITAAQSTLMNSKYVAIYPWTVDYTLIGQATMWDILVITKRSETLVNNVPRSIALAQVPSAWESAALDGTPLKVNIQTREGFYNDRCLRFYKPEESTIGSVFTRLDGLEIPYIPGNPHTATIKVATSETWGQNVRIAVYGYDMSDQLIQQDISPIVLVSSEPQQLSIEFTMPVGTGKITVGVITGSSEYLRYLDIGEVGLREGDDPTWIPESTNVLETMRRLRSVPAGVKLYHDTFASDWDTIEAVLPTWDDWEAVTWNELEETELP